MTDIDIAINCLKEKNIESFERMGILVIPVFSPDDIYDTATKMRRIFKEIGFEKSWQIDPYYFEKRASLSAVMFDDVAKNTPPIVEDNFAQKEENYEQKKQETSYTAC